MSSRLADKEELSNILVVVKRCHTKVSFYHSIWSSKTNKHLKDSTVPSILPELERDSHI